MNHTKTEKGPLVAARNPNSKVNTEIINEFNRFSSACQTLLSTTLWGLVLLLSSPRFSLLEVQRHKNTLALHRAALQGMAQHRGAYDAWRLHGAARTPEADQYMYFLNLRCRLFKQGELSAFLGGLI